MNLTPFFIQTVVSEPDPVLGRTPFWDDLAGPLRDLNIATGFNLIFVGAACWSDSSIYTVSPTPQLKPLPFMLAVGFATSVHSDRLELAMLQLYKGLLLEKHSIQSSLELAHAKLDPSTEGLAWFSLPRIIKNAAIDAVKLINDPESNTDRYTHMAANLGAAGKKPITPAEFHRNHLTHAPAAIEKIIGTLLAYDSIPTNRARFGFDGSRLAKEALRGR